MRKTLLCATLSDRALSATDWRSDIFFFRNPRGCWSTRLSDNLTPSKICLHASTNSSSKLGKRFISYLDTVTSVTNTLQCRSSGQIISPFDYTDMSFSLFSIKSKAKAACSHLCCSLPHPLFSFLYLSLSLSLSISLLPFLFYDRLMYWFITTFFVNFRVSFLTTSCKVFFF